MACPTGKRRYRDEIAAKHALAVIRRQDKPHHQEKRVYRCPRCRGFHLTKKAKRGGLTKP